MELINELAFDKWGFSLYGYFGDVFIPWRTLALLGLVVVALRIRKVIKTRKAGK
jgi:hypothetical protein